jgi:hypothetical protein
VISETNRVIYLEDGDVVALRRGGVEIVDRDGTPVQRKEHLSELTADAVDLGPYPHYMQKEIHEQPRAIADTLEGVIDGGVEHRGLYGAGAEKMFRDIDAVLILASGTSHNAGWCAPLDRGAGAGAVRVELGHEYRYRDSIPNPRQLVVTISQSGETLDTMEALKRAVQLGQAKTLSICNVRESAIPRPSGMSSIPAPGARSASPPPRRSPPSWRRFSRSRSRSPRHAGALSAARARRHRAAALRSRAACSTRSTSSRRSRLGRAIRRARPCALPRARDALPGGARGCIEAEGDLLHPRRGLSRGRAETRAAGAG